jgi:hypothetical protein
MTDMRIVYAGFEAHIGTIDAESVEVLQARIKKALDAEFANDRTQDGNLSPWIEVEPYESAGR